MMKGVNLSFTAKNRAAPAMKSFQNNLRGAKRQLDATTVANKRFSQSLGGSTWRRQIQQAGMQISDFSVQVAGGQSAMLAFTQNFPQFIQNFGARGGILAAVVTILGTFAFMTSRAGSAVKEFSKQIDETSGAVDEYFSILQSNKGLAATLFSEAKESLQGTSQAVKDLTTIAKLEAIRSVQNLAKSLANASTEAGIFSKIMMEGDRAITGDLLGIDTALRGHIGTWKDAHRRVQEFIDATRGIGESGDINEMLAQAIKTRDIFKQNVDVTGNMADAQLKFWKQLNQTIRQLELVGAAVEATDVASTNNIELMRRAAKVFNDERFEGNQEARDMLANLKREVDMMRTVAMFGSDSAQANELRAEQERAVLEETLSTMNASENLKASVLSMFDAKVRITQQTSRWSATMGSVRQEIDAILSSLSSLSGGMIANAAKRAEIAALKQGKSIAEAQREQQKLNKELEFSARLRTAQAKGGVAGFAQTQLIKAERAQFRMSLELDAQLEAARKATRENTKGAAAGIKAAQKELEKLQDLMVGIHPALRTALEGVDDLTLDTAKRIKTQFEDMQNAISGSMMSSFRGLLDGTKSLGDAIRNVLNSIISKIIDMMMMPVFNSIAGSITGSIMGTIGNNATGTNNWRGGLTRVNERGGEIMNLPRGTQIIPNDISKRMVDNVTGSRGAAAQPQDVNINVNVDGANGDQHVVDLVGQGVREGLGQYDRQLPGRVKQINRDPRAR